MTSYSVGRAIQTVSCHSSFGLAYSKMDIPKAPSACFSLSDNCIVYCPMGKDCIVHHPKDAILEIRFFKWQGAQLLPTNAGCCFTSEMWVSLGAASECISKAIHERRFMEIPCGEWLVACVRPYRGVLGVWLSADKYGNLWLSPTQWRLLCQQAEAITAIFKVDLPAPPPLPALSSFPSPLKNEENIAEILNDPMKLLKL